MKGISFLFVIVAVLAAGMVAWLRLRPAGGPEEDPKVLGRLAADTVVPAFAHPREAELFRTAAERAWAYVEAGYEPRTGLIRTVTEYPVATVWDIGSGIAALVAAHDLGFLARAGYEERLGRVLATLERMPLFEGVAFNKTYSTSSARMLSREETISERGFGWSATDLGRLLIWLRIVSDREPAFAATVRRVVDRLDFDRLVHDGYLQGEDLDRRGRLRMYREGTLGYEQYAAAGFALWGHAARYAQSLTANAEPLGLWGETVLVDRRARGCLTSEPFVLSGLELGWSPAMRLQAVSLLRVQEARWQRTGQITIASEDASLIPPHHFYYYCVHADGAPFHVFAMGHVQTPDGPRTVSAKAAFAWYALLPAPYTARAVDHVMEAWLTPSVLIAGVDEASGRAVGPPNVNTAAVILEAAAYLARGRPLMAF